MGNRYNKIKEGRTVPKFLNFERRNPNEKHEKFVSVALTLMLLAGLFAALPAIAEEGDAAVTPVPAGTDLFIGHNPGFENTPDDGNGGWEEYP